MYSLEVAVWTTVELYVVQILVIVASIQIRFLKTEVEKVSMWTAFGHGLGDPKKEVLSIKKFLLVSKGKSFTITTPYQ